MEAMLLKNVYRVDPCFHVYQVREALGIKSETTWQKMRKRDISTLEFRQIRVMLQHGTFSVDLIKLLSVDQNCDPVSSKIRRLDQLHSEMKSLLESSSAPAENIDGE